MPPPHESEFAGYTSSAFGSRYDYCYYHTDHKSLLDVERGEVTEKIVIFRTF
jgi:hypothetical protein